jgi:hypothetical protein
MINPHDYYGKLAHQETLSYEDCVDLLKALTHFKNAAIYLASCQAATLEILPKSASQSMRNRHVTLCNDAAKLLDGDASPIKYTESIAAAKERCEKAVKNNTKNK